MKVLQITEQIKYGNLVVYTAFVALMLLLLGNTTSAHIAEAYGGQQQRVITIKNVSGVNVNELYIHPTGTKAFYGEVYLGEDGVFSPGETVTAKLEVYDSTYRVYAGQGHSFDGDALGYTLVDMEDVQVYPSEHFNLGWGSFTKVSESPAPPKWCVPWDKNWHPACTNS